MGKKKPRPAGYNPPLQFLLRQKPEGGDILSPGKFADDRGMPSRRSCVVMVHGFNNTDGEAAYAYFGFRNQQISAFGVSLQELDARLGEVGRRHGRGVDCQLETPAGGVHLHELAAGSPVLVRTDAGPRLVVDPWQVGP